MCVLPTYERIIADDFNLLAIGIYKPPDVRPILQAYQGKDIPLEYAKREAEDKLVHVENWKQKGKGVDVTFSRLFNASSVSQNAPLYLRIDQRHFPGTLIPSSSNLSGAKAKRSTSAIPGGNGVYRKEQG